MAEATSNNPHALGIFEDNAVGMFPTPESNGKHNQKLLCLMQLQGAAMSISLALSQF